MVEPLKRSVTFERTYIISNDESDDDDEIDNEEEECNEVTDVIVDLDNSSEFDTDLEDTYEFQTQKKENPYGENDDIIGRNIYVTACERFGHVAPQRRILDELEKKTLNLTHRSLGPDAIRPLCIALVDNLRIENLILDGCDIGDQGVVYVAQLLLDNLVISRLNLSNNSMGESCSKALSIALTSNNTLLHLNLSDNKLDDNAAFGLAPGLAKNSVLVKINLSWNGLGYEGAVGVSKALKQCHTLKYLDISHNRINWDAALVISKSLAVNCSLETLKVGDNPLTTTGANDIVQAASSDKCQLRLLDLMNVAVLADTEFLAIIIQRKRKFKFIHGGIVHTPDVLGQRKEREITAMERVIEYMRRLGIRPVELLRAFDKSVSFNVTKKEFIGRLKKTNVGLHQYEMEALANAVASKGMDGGGISYRKLVDAVQDEVLLERNRKIAERKRKEKRIALHKRILDVKLPVEAVSEVEEEIALKKAILEGQTGSFTRPGTGMSSLSSSSFTTLSLLKDKPFLASQSSSSLLGGSRSYAKLPIIELDTVREKQVPVIKSKSKTSLSMCAPLEKSTKEKKKKKKKRIKKSSHDRQVPSWMSSYQV
ncbi:hypothetical protein FSP39_001215 [Pinctada imbricata]|uniref:Uncharacterized protein n=1 Tax=Pinctada imbricata TaxID=66713 RepID=A0AA89BZL8_PINIB|nr:hypothetical protein FSP39_001215 [Pinctada imbricata]